MKEEIRNQLIALRNASIPADRVHAGKLITERIVRMKVFREAKCIMIYLPHLKEVDTTELLRRAIEKKKIAVPAMIEGEIAPVIITPQSKFAPMTFGIQEPEERVQLCDPQTLDLVIVPGVAFDQKGNRIGFGKGYFDRFLKKCRCPLIGIGYDFQIVEKIPIESYDVPVDFIVTEKRLIQCQPSKKKTRRSTIS